MTSFVEVELDELRPRQQTPSSSRTQLSLRLSFQQFVNDLSGSRVILIAVCGLFPLFLAHITEVITIARFLAHECLVNELAVTWFVWSDATSASVKDLQTNKAYISVNKYYEGSCVFR